MRLVLLASAAVALAGCGSAIGKHATGAACSTYPNQAAAQAAGTARDADGDGVLCESLPCPCKGGTGAGRPVAPAGGSPPRGGAGTVVSVADGDTVTVSLDGGRREHVRLIGIDAPEKSSLRYGHPQCGGKEAGEAAQRLAERYPRVTLTLDPSQDSRDRYGRLLAYVDIPAQHTSYQRELLAAGWGRVYVYRREFSRVTEFRKAETEARDSRRGVWRLCPYPPKDGPGGPFSRWA